MMRMKLLVVIATIAGALLALLPWPTPVRIVEAEDQCAASLWVERTPLGLLCIGEYGMDMDEVVLGKDQSRVPPDER
jgi:hypothetical protein